MVVICVLPTFAIWVLPMVGIEFNICYSHHSKWSFMFPVQRDTPFKRGGCLSCFSPSISYPWENFSLALWANDGTSEGRSKGWQSEVVCQRWPGKGMVWPSSHPYLCMCTKAQGGWPQELCFLSPPQFSPVLMPLCSDDIFLQDIQWHKRDHRVGNLNNALWYRSCWRTVTIRRR